MEAKIFEIRDDFTFDDAVSSRRHQQIMRDLNERGLESMDELAGSNIIALPEGSDVLWTIKSVHSNLSYRLLTLASGDDCMIYAKGKADVWHATHDADGTPRLSPISPQSPEFVALRQLELADRASDRDTSTSRPSAAWLRLNAIARANGLKASLQVSEHPSPSPELEFGVLYRDAITGAVMPITSEIRGNGTAESRIDGKLINRVVATADGSLQEAALSDVIALARARMGSALPKYDLYVHLQSADGCEGYFSVSLDAENKPVVGEITWSPAEPDAETISATFRRHIDGMHDSEYVVDGDTWRAIEDRDLADELYTGLCVGKDIELAIEELNLLGSAMRM